MALPGARLERGIKLRINRAVPMELIRGKSEGLVLPQPFDGQITQARDPQPVRQMPLLKPSPESSKRSDRLIQTAFIWLHLRFSAKVYPG